MDDGDVLTPKQVKELQKRNAQIRRGKPHLKKSDCHIHATLRQRLDAVQKLRFLHDIRTLCRALNVIRSTYYIFERTQLLVSPKTGTLKP